MSNLPKELLIISYRAGVQGDVLAEFTDDKLRVATFLGIRTTLVTALGSKPFISDNLKTIQVPSISYKDFILEQENISNYFKKIPKWVKVYSIVPRSIGRIFDFIFKRINGSSGHARWSWAISAFMVSVYICFRYKHRSVYAVGSVAAYLAGVFNKLITFSKLYVEVPDPIIAKEMERTKTKSKIICIIEMFLILNSQKFIYTTKKAFTDAAIRYPKLKHRILYVYPQAWNFNIKPILHPNKQQITIVHLGSVYGTRNFDSLFLALDNLYRKNSNFRDKILLINLGPLDCGNKEMYLARKDFKSLPALSREDALVFGSLCDYLLLLQHADNRSAESIPYKIYDYINLGKPIFCIINNPEIEFLLEKRAHIYISNLSDVKSIEKSLLKLISSKRFNSFDSEKQNHVTDQVTSEKSIIDNFRLMFSA